MMTPILPGATIGIFGSGQLGRMIAQAAKRMGYRVHTFSPEPDSPTGQVADHERVSRYDDLEAITAFIRNTDVVTFEFENIDASVADVAESLGVPVHPGGWVLATAQNRIREKSTLREAGLPVTPFVPVQEHDDMARIGEILGFPIVLKTASSGYDGKGQSIVGDDDELVAAWVAMGSFPAVAEQLIPYAKELSVVAARGWTGEYADFGVIENLHRNHILDQSIAPARVSESVRKTAQALTRQALETLNVIGTLCVEYFLTEDDLLLINEIAPRPHNSGHLTIEACCTSQFEQHVRAICGLPLGSTTQMGHAVMVNLLGDIWTDGEPDWTAALRNETVKLHLYGKTEARQGRKMGHLTVVAGNSSEALQIALDARAALQRIR